MLFLAIAQEKIFLTKPGHCTELLERKHAKNITNTEFQGLDGYGHYSYGFYFLVLRCEQFREIPRQAIRNISFLSMISDC